MNSYNKIQFEEAEFLNVVDTESLRIERLIEEREEYESSFFSFQDILKSEELNYAISEFEYCQESFFDSFEFEDYLLELRDEELIEEREEYENKYFSTIEDEIIEMDSLDLLIKSYDRYEYSDYLEIENYFEDYDYDDEFDFFEDAYIEDSNFMEITYCGCNYQDYMPNDDLYDRLDGCDYPAGPNENLGGVIYY